MIIPVPVLGAMAARIREMDINETSHSHRVKAIRSAAAKKNFVLPMGVARSYVMYVEMIVGVRPTE